MAIDKKLQIFDDEGNPVDYDILASDVKFLPDGKDLPTKLAEMEEEIGEGGYTPPAGGIPKTDLAPSVQQTLDDVANKVDKVPGKGLSTNDYTTEEKTKLGNLPTNPVQSISVNGGTAQTPTNGNVNVVVPTVVLDDVPTAGSPNGVKSGGVKQAIDKKLTQVVVNEISGAADIITIDDADLALIDEDGNIAMRVDEGHVETANFDSRQVATNTSAIQQLQSQIGQQGSVQTDVVVKNDGDAAFDIADESGKVAMRITNQGHIKTKGFDSENIDMFRALKMDNPQCSCHGYGAVSGYGNDVANSIPYYRQGYINGYRFFEVDAVRCSDGVPICVHYNANGRTVYDKTTHEATTVPMSSVNGVYTVGMASNELVSGYTWDAAGNVPIALLTDAIWQICYFYRCPIQLDGQGLTAADRLAISQYAESLGVGQYVFHELKGGGYTNWNIPCNSIITAGSVANIQSQASTHKKSDNNIIFHCDNDFINGNSDETLASLAEAAHAVGCYIMANASNANIAKVRSLFRCGFDVCLTSGIVNSQV